MFFAPLPGCIAFRFFSSLIKRKIRIARNQDAESKNQSSNKLKALAWVVGVLMGGVWFILGVSQVSSADGFDRVIMLLIFTLYGIGGSLVALALSYVQEKL